MRTRPYPKIHRAASAGDITILLAEWGEGDVASFNHMISLTYDELSRAARAQLRNERRNHTLQTADLVHEAYLRISKVKMPRFENRKRFFTFITRIMRHILVDYARKHPPRKRSNAEKAVQCSISLANGKVLDSDTLIWLDNALRDLERMSPRQCRITELRFFVGLSCADVAQALDLSPRTIAR